MLSIVPDRKADKIEDETEQDTSVGVPSPPDWMSFEAKMEWFRSAPDLHKKGKLVGGNISLLENYCVLIGEVRECEAMLATDGKIVGGKPHPAFDMMMKAMAGARSIASELRFGKDNLSEEEKTVGSGWEPGLLA